MSGIPSDIAGSAAQAGYQAREAARHRDADKTQQAQTARDRIRAVQEAAGSVDTSDDGTQVYADAEGTGGQGRPFEEGGEAKEQHAAPEDRAALDGRGENLDLQA
jgi:hypothetical protein